MATHSSILAWKIPWIEEPGPWGHTVRHDQAHTHQGNQGMTDQFGSDVPGDTENGVDDLKTQKAS